MRGELPQRPVVEEVIARGLDDRMWEIMESCWAIDPSSRPADRELVVILGQLHGASEATESLSIVEGTSLAALRLTEVPEAPPRPVKRIRLEED